MSSIVYRKAQILYFLASALILASCGGGEDKLPSENTSRVGAPLNLGVVPGNGIVLVTWTIPNSVGKPDYYTLEKSIDNQKTFVIVNGSISANEFSYTDSTAQNGVAHVYRIAGTNEVGRGQWSVSDPVTPKASLLIDLPGEPQNVIATGVDGSVTIDWQAPKTGAAASYRIERAIDNNAMTIISGKIPATTLTFTDPNAIIGLRHVYHVSAANSLGFYGKPGISNEVIPLKVVSGLPNAARRFTAIAGDSSVTLRWEPAPVGGLVTYFKVDKSIDNKGSFTTVNAQIAKDVFTIIDTGLTNGDSYVYRIIAGNNNDVSLESFSNIAIPTLGNATTTRLTLISNQPAKFNSFGNALAFSPDGNTVVIAEIGGNATQTTRPGVVQVFSKVNNGWSYSQTLKTSATGNTDLFGFAVAFSPDGLILAVGGEYNSVTGDTVYLYTKPADSWIELQKISLSSANGISSTGFGTSLSFNADNTTLAIGEKNGIVNAQKVGSAHIYTADVNNSWSLSVVITANRPTLNNEFGAVVRFSPDGNTLAVGETKGDTTTISDAGIVHLFTKPVAPIMKWAYLASLESKNPQTGNLFGADNNTIVFSPDNNSLAIGESKGELLAGKANNGTVAIFTKTAGVWSTTATVLTAQASNSFGFGNAVSFSADGFTLAIGESNGGVSQVGIVHLYTLATTPTAIWSFSKKLTALKSSARNKFGTIVLFSPVGNTLAVSEIRADTKLTIDSGAVDIIELSPIL